MKIDKRTVTLIKKGLTERNIKIIEQESMSSSSLYLHCYESDRFHLNLQQLSNSLDSVITIRLSNHLLPTKYDGQRQLIESIAKFNSLDYDHWSDLLESVLNYFGLECPMNAKVAKKRWIKRRLDSQKNIETTAPQKIVILDSEEKIASQRKNDLIEQLSHEVTNENLKFALNKAIISAQSVYEARSRQTSDQSLKGKNNRLRKKLIAFRKTLHEEKVRELTRLIKIYGI
ncbi:hypothetical protein ACP3V3_02795 [Vibrio sp. PNB22_3_1]